MSRTLLIITVASMATFSTACVETEELPRDLHEDGWDELSSQTRIRVLEDELEVILDELEYTVGEKRHKLVRQAVRKLSSLRPELMAEEEGRAEYLELEARLEQLSGDAP